MTIPMPMSARRGAAIAGSGAYVPDTVVTNDDLAARMDTSDAWIRSHIGIVERRWARPDQAMSDLALPAARQALSRAGVGPEDLDLIVVAGSAHDYLMPATAALLQASLGARHAGVLDIKNACSGFVYALGAAGALVETGIVDTALVVGAEVHSRIINPDDRTMAPFFGDGAGAVVLRPSRPGTGLLSAYYGADGDNADAIMVEAGGSRRPVDAEALAAKAHLCRMDGPRVKTFIQEVFPLSVERACERAGVRVADLRFVIAHQANLHLIREGMEQLGLGMERTLTLLERYGNSGSASVPTVLDAALEQGRIRPGDLVAMSAFGAGLAYGAITLRWAGPEDFLP